MEKMDKIQCKYIEDYPDIQKSSIHISSETKKYLDGADQLKLKKFFRPIYKGSYIIFVEIDQPNSIAYVYTSDEDWKMQFYQSLNEKEEDSILLLALPGTKFESTIKDFYVKIKSELDTIPQMIAGLTGIRPTNIGYYCYKGITCKWSYDTLQFPEDTMPINVISYKYKNQLYYKPDKELDVVKKFMVEWHKQYRGLSSYDLAYYIPNILFVPWIPCFVNNRYGIKIPSYLRDKLVKGEQYEIKDEII